MEMLKVLISGIALALVFSPGIIMGLMIATKKDDVEKIILCIGLSLVFIFFMAMALSTFYTISAASLIIVSILVDLAIIMLFLILNTNLSFVSSKNRKIYK